MASLSENMAALQGILGAQQQGFTQSRARAMAPEREAMEREKFRQNQLINQLNIQEAQQALPLQQQLLQSKVEALPMQRQLDQLKLQKLEQQLQTGRQGIAEADRQSKIRDVIAIGNIAEQVKAQNIQDPQERLNFARGLMSQAGYEGIIRPGDESIDKINRAIAARDSFIKSPDLSAGEREFDMLTEGLSERDKEIARRIKLGLAPRAVGSASQTIAETGRTGAVAASEAEIAGAKKEAGLTAELKLKPEIEKAVATSVASAKADADAIANQKSDDAAFNLYQTAFSGLSSALGQTATGPFFGLIPAFTSKQQIADGAIAAVAPILKQMFRAAGEGTFTDSDQKILLDMIPTRKDKPDAREAKLLNIDAIVRSKLKQAEGGGRRFKYNPATREFE
jgi:hypothetical protein